MRHLSSSEVREKLTMPKAIEAMGRAFSDLSSGEAQVPDRLPLHTASPTEYLFMPAYYPSGRITTIKSVSINAENPGKGLPLIQAVILVFEHDSGKPIATIDGNEVTAIRTAAASGLATKLFASPKARHAAIFGTGVQARSHIEALMAVRDLERIFIYGREIKKAIAFCQQNQPAFRVELVATGDPNDLLKADIICTVTTSDSPVFEHKYLKRGVHINAVGAFKPDCREVPSQTVMAADVYIDQWEGAMAEAGDLLVPLSKKEIDKDHIRKEIGRVISGEIKYDWSPKKITLFKSVGNAIQDAAAAEVLISEIENE